MFVHLFTCHFPVLNFYNYFCAGKLLNIIYFTRFALISSKPERVSYLGQQMFPRGDTWGCLTCPRSDISNTKQDSAVRSTTLQKKKNILILSSCPVQLNRTGILFNLLFIWFLCRKEMESQCKN